jgi:hypothetical protein
MYARSFAVAHAKGTDFRVVTRQCVLASVLDNTATERLEPIGACMKVGG